MFLTEYNEEKIMEKEHQEGVKKGTNQERERVAADLLKEGGMSVSFISKRGSDLQKGIFVKKPFGGLILMNHGRTSEEKFKGALCTP